MNELYQPSSGTEGEGFISEWCYNCEHDRANREDPDSGKGCDILVRTMVFNTDDPEYPREWIIASDGPRCTAFQEESDDPKPPRIRERDDKTVDMWD